MSFEYIIYILLFVVWGIIVYKNLRASVLLLPLFFPLYLVKFNILAIPVYFVEGLILISAVPIFYNLLTGRCEALKKGFGYKIMYLLKLKFLPKKKGFKEFLKSVFLPIVLFLIACSISALIVKGDYAMHALGILKSWVIIPLIYFYTLYSVIKNNKDIKFTMYAYIVSALILGLWGLYQAASGQYITIDDRISGPFASANYLAMYITPAFIFAAVRFIQTFMHLKFASANRRFVAFEKRIYLGLFAAFLFAVLVLTQSYGGILGAFVAIFIYVIYQRIKTRELLVKKFLNKIIGFVLLFVVLGGTLSVSLNIEKFQNLTKLDEHTSISTRVEIWQVGLNLLKENPIFGIGLGQYQTNYNERATEILGHAPFEEERLHSHNLYLETWLNSGLLGIVSFIWIIVLAYLSFKKIKPGTKKDLALVALIMLSYLLIHGLIDVTFWKNDLSLIFWLIMGVNFSLLKNGN
ncbi:O-antigen ligase family protein [Patescibacteria group bacterium]